MECSKSLIGIESTAVVTVMHLEGLVHLLQEFVQRFEVLHVHIVGV